MSFRVRAARSLQSPSFSGESIVLDGHTDTRSHASSAQQHQEALDHGREAHGAHVDSAYQKPNNPGGAGPGQLDRQTPGPVTAARSRWIPRPRWEDRENTLEAGQSAALDASGWPRKPLPPHLNARLQRRIKEMVWDHDMLLALTERIARIPKTRVADDQHTGRRAGIMLPLCSVDGKPGVLFNLRSMNVGTHKGQVCFPGGHLDVTDECMETCATRETQEELGVQVWRPTDRALWEAGWQHRPFYPSSNILGRLPNAVAITGTLVTPVVGYLGPVDLADLSRRANKAEIAEVFAIPIQDLLDPTHMVYESILLGDDMPAFMSGKHRVWGLTAFILHHFLIEVALPVLLEDPVLVDPSTPATTLGTRPT